MAFLAELERVAQVVEARLDRLLAQDRGNAPQGARLAEAMRYAALGGGKRLRPFLLIESARMFGMAPDDALSAACALECVHCYSLVHDDLPSMDDDDLRRGRPTCHRAFDEATAILVGDALQVLAFEILAHDPDMIDATRKYAAARAVPPARYEFQMLYGIRRDLQADLHNRGHGVRVYVPFGREWFPYFMRRLGERPANIGFVIRGLLRERSTQMAL